MALYIDENGDVQDDGSDDMGGWLGNDGSNPYTGGGGQTPGFSYGNNNPYGPAPQAPGTQNPLDPNYGSQDNQGADGTGGNTGQNGFNIGGANGGVTIGTSGAGSADTDNSATIGAPGINVSPEPVTTTFGAGIPGLTTTGAARGSLQSTGTPTAPTNQTPGAPPGTTQAPGGGTGQTPTGTQGSPPGTTTNNTTNNPGGGPGNGIFDNLLSAGGLSSIIAALKQFSDSADLKQLGMDASKTANPFGQYRQQYGDELSKLESDPSEIANTPGYKFALSQGLGAVSAASAGKSGIGAGSTDVDRMNYAQGKASSTYNDTIAQLSSLAGAPFNPATAGSLQLAGGVASLNASDSALGSLLNGALGGASKTPSTSGSILDPSTWTTGDLSHYVSGAPISSTSPTDPNAPGSDSGYNSTNTTTDPNLAYLDQRDHG